MSIWLVLRSSRTPGERSNRPRERDRPAMIIFICVLLDAVHYRNDVHLIAGYTALSLLNCRRQFTPVYPSQWLHMPGRKDDEDGPS